LSLLIGPPQRAAKLVSLERRGADRLIEKVPGIQPVIAQKLKDRAMQLVVEPDCVTTLTCAPERLPYSAE
jgi:hypothetical protein